MAIHPTAEFWNELKLHSKTTQHVCVSEWPFAEISNEALCLGKERLNQTDMIFSLINLNKRYEMKS